MSELISAHSVRHPNRVTELELLQTEPLFAGGYESKQVITATQEGHSITFIGREYTPGYVNNWLAFDEANMPVVPTLHAYESADRKAADASGPDRLLLTDMKADGSELYGKGLLLCLKDGVHRERARRDIDDLFFDLTTSSQIMEIEERAWEHTRTAFQNRLRLPADNDAYELLIRPDGSWDLITLDLGFAGVVGPTTSLEEAATFNHGLTKAFLNNLRRLRAYLADDEMAA